LVHRKTNFIGRLDVAFGEDASRKTKRVMQRKTFSTSLIRLASSTLLKNLKKTAKRWGLQRQNALKSPGWD